MNVNKTISDHSEIGEELLAPMLEAGTVVVLVGTHRPDDAFTAWVVGVDLPHGVLFACAEIGLILGLRANAGGQLFDQLNHRIEVHKYLGVI